MSRRIGRSTVELIGSALLSGANRDRVGRSTVELVGDSLLPARGLLLPQVSVTSQTAFLAVNLVAGSPFTVSPRGNPYGGIVIGPAPSDPALAVFSYIEPDRGFMIESDPGDWYDQNMVFTLCVDVDNNNWFLRANGVAIPMTSAGFEPDPAGITYGDIMGRIPHNATAADSQMAELILFNSVVHIDNIYRVEGYLNCKWQTPGGAAPENNYCIPEI